MSDNNNNDDEQIGCNNVEEHDDGDPLVMWPEDVL